MQSDALGAVEHLGRAHHAGVFDAVEGVAHDHVHELIDEQNRRISQSLPHQIYIGGFQRLVAEQVIAERNHLLPVLTRIGIGDGRDVRCHDLHARIGAQRGMKRAFGIAGIRRRDQFGTRHIDLQEIVGQQQPTATFVAVEQMMATGNPKIFHLLSRPAMPIRSTDSTGASSSPSTSRKENARKGFGPLRGRSVRKAS